MLAPAIIPTFSEEHLNIPIEPGEPIFIVGRNGSGKSALVNHLRRELPDPIIYLPGSRHSYFDSDSLQITPEGRRSLNVNLSHWDKQPEARFRPTAGTHRNEKAIYDLLAAEIQFKLDAANDIVQKKSVDDAVQRLQSNASPLDRVNSLLRQASLPIRICVDQAELRAASNRNVFSLARMSDGERTALIFASEVIAADAGTIFLVDEPELHLHPAIVLPLITALITERQDCGFIVSTHELGLPVEHERASVVVVNGCNWVGDRVMNWDVYLLPATERIPELLRIDLLGARKKILFIEGHGAVKSLDHPLYALLFPEVSVHSRGSCNEVIHAVEGLRSLMDIHHSLAFGLIDHDGMSQAQLETFEAKGIFPLPFYSVESIYYCDEALASVAEQQARTLGDNAAEMLQRAKDEAIDSLEAVNLEHLAGRICERHLRDKVLAALPSRDDLRAGELISIQCESPYPAELEKVTSYWHSKSLSAIIERYPVRETKILDKLAKGLRFQGRTDYEKAVLARITQDLQLQAVLKDKLRNLAQLLSVAD